MQRLPQQVRIWPAGPISPHWTHTPRRRLWPCICRVAIGVTVVIVGVVVAIVAIVVAAAVVGVTVVVLMVRIRIRAGTIAGRSGSS